VYAPVPHLPEGMVSGTSAFHARKGRPCPSVRPLTADGKQFPAEVRVSSRRRVDTGVGAVIGQVPFRFQVRPGPRRLHRGWTMGWRQHDLTVIGSDEHPADWAG
jgi:hypothetical protein